jgi:hypothetical protein
MGWAVLLCAVVAILAAALSTTPVLSLVGAYGRYESLPMRLSYLGLFWGTLQLGPPQGAPDEDLRRWRGRIEVCFLAGCGVAAAEAVVHALLQLQPRPDGNLGQPDLLGVLLAMALPLLAARLVRFDGAAWRWIPLAALLVTGLLLSSSRGAWLAALVGLGWWACRSAWERSSRDAARIAAGVLALLGGGVALFFSTPLRALNQDTGAARLGVWGDGLRMIAARPLLGWGEDATGLRFGAFVTADWEPGDRFDRLHSMPLDLLATQGVLGLLACSALFLLVWRGLLVSPGSTPLAGALAAYLAWSLFDFDWVPATAPCWLLAGAALAGTYPLRESRSIFFRRTRGLLAAASVAVALLVALPPLGADVARYVGDVQLATRLDPLQAAYWAALQTPTGLGMAARLETTDPQVWVQLGDVTRERGHVAEARRDYEQALAIYPYDAEARARVTG